MFFTDDFLHIFFPNRVKNTAYKLFYSKYGQDVSVGNYWRDPHHINKFLNYSNFLAKVDNCIPTPSAIDFKNNFIRLKKLILIGGKW